MDETPEQPSLTLTEQVRRAQFIEVTIDLVAAHGYAGTSLARIAEAAGVTKAAVLYHYASKDALVLAAHQHVLTALTDHVAAAVESADPASAPAAYIRSMVGHLHDHPHHIRVVAEAMTAGGKTHDSRERWQPFADLLHEARTARGVDSPLDLRTTAIIVGGAVDAVVAEFLADPDYDTASAADLLVTVLDRLLDDGGAPPA